jgi:mannose-6-phosphate isomerase-like protein (cupin superfamily)
MDPPLRVTLDEARQAPIPTGARSAVLMERGSMTLRYYAPPSADTQTPHDRDEVYVVVSGSGTFRAGERRAAFAAGDVLFVAAGVEHRFETFTEDFATWVVFYGPRGGERP